MSYVSACLVPEPCQQLYKIILVFIGLGQGAFTKANRKHISIFVMILSTSLVYVTSAGSNCQRHVKAILTNFLSSKWMPFEP